MIKKILFICLAWALIAGPLQAQSNQPQSSINNAIDNLGKIGQDTGLGDQADTNIYGRLASYINVILGLIGIIAAIYIIFAGIRWLRAGGNEQEVTIAKETIKNAVYGLIAIFGAYALVNFVILKLIGSIAVK